MPLSCPSIERKPAMPEARRRAFTLIELVCVIVVLGVLSAVAIPVYLDHSRDAAAAACRGALGGLRAGIANYYAWSATPAGGGASTFPSLAALAAPGVTLAQDIPANPFDRSGAPNNVVDATGQAPGAIIGSDGGWCYNPDTGEIWANTSTKSCFENTF